MPFTNAERVKIRGYLGWPLVGVWSSGLESAMDQVGADADAATEVRSVLTQIASIETEIAGLHGIALASRVEESALDPKRYENLRAAGRREVQRLASMLFNATINADVFATSSAGSTSYSLRMG